MLQTLGRFRSSFWFRIGLGVTLVALADALFFIHQPGTTVGGFALAILAAVILARRGLLRDPRAVTALLAAFLLALVMIDRPGPLAWLLFGLASSVAVLSARTPAGETAWGWAQRLVVQGVVAAFGPLIDLFRLSRLKRRVGGLSILALIGRLVMPVVGGAVFLGLFATANPVISDFLEALSLPSVSFEAVAHGLFWGVILVGAMSLLRPRWTKKTLALPTRKIGKPSPALATSIAWSLIVFNAVFALQNGLDIAFLWSGSPLPGDMGLADYAHRGAYPLIATALLAGLFVLVALRPGSDTARRPLVRRLVVVWIAQNMLLVASSLLRTADYIEAYALTRFRIAAMAWMVLVGVGLLLICWRMLKDKSTHWLLNANALVALAVLAGVSVIDLGAVAAAWNVRHAREMGGRGVELDLGYMHTLDEPALVSLVELEQATDDPALRDRASAVRQDIQSRARDRQDHWRGWTWRTARRLDRIKALRRAQPLTPPQPGKRDWDGRLVPPPPPPVVLVPPPIVAPITVQTPRPTPSPLTFAPLTSAQGH